MSIGIKLLWIQVQITVAFSPPIINTITYPKNVRPAAKKMIMIP